MSDDNDTIVSMDEKHLLRFGERLIDAMAHVGCQARISVRRSGISRYAHG